MKILVLMLSESVLLNIQELAVWLQKWSLQIRSGQIQNFCRLCRLTAVVSQIRCNNGCMNRWKSGYSKFVSLKPLSQQNPFLSLKAQASSEIIWFEMLYRTDHWTFRRLSLCTSRFHEIEPSLCTYLLFRTIVSPENGMAWSGVPPVSLLCCYIPLQCTWLAFFLNTFSNLSHRNK